VRKLYWDTSVFLCFLNPVEETRRQICEDILQHARAKEVTIYTSTYAIAEAIRPKRIDAKRLSPEDIARIEGMFRWSWLKKIDVDQRVAFKAVELARDRGLRPADAVHAATAILRDLDVLQRWDNDFSAVADLIAIEEPGWMTAQLRLIDQSRIGPAPGDFSKPSK
jgi:predicted nucleic acid-binding protein